MYVTHTCPNCGEQAEILCDGRVLKPYEWCLPCKDAHQKEDWAVRWFNHRFHVFSKRDIYLRDGCKCYICHKHIVFKGKDATFDHEIPNARGGFTSFSNLRLCCVKCNNKKGDLMLDELFDQYGGPDTWV